MMRKFWQIMGGTYLFLFKRRKVILGLVITVLVVGQLFLLIWLVVGQVKIKKDMKKNQDAVVKLLNKTYSQAWQLNTKFNQREAAANPKK
ncbi:MAG: hypothetical protein UT32_C0009G0043 [Parcubacteria group bacterium GW2011_GWC2_39_14]|nr:MAG: hypothetical protein UT32_C0009G0043 [Parcubacteria group bacterium GW2011_GWC2_39_14]KKR55381.1 MAG: hypothetical protein UT91_C0002G0042 [Parcubacteria group bacterium GW2011_GWA2_40_23]